MKVDSLNKSVVWCINGGSGRWNGGNGVAVSVENSLTDGQMHGFGGMVKEETNFA